MELNHRSPGCHLGVLAVGPLGVRLETRGLRQQATGLKPQACPSKKSPMSLRHRAFISRQTVFRPSVTSAMDAAGNFVGAHYLAPRNNPPPCMLGSNLVVKTSWKQQPELAFHLRPAATTAAPAPLYTVDAERVPRVHKKNLGRRKAGASSSRWFSPGCDELAQFRLPMQTPSA
jgi:hypothetical protein